ncbi:MAG: hypothetical protein EXS43_00315 [Opitutus sp.]|nr:hypothetical protein [Opitutus sp.]
MNIAARIREALGAKPDDAGDILARMLMAAKEDPAFSDYILSILRMPPAQRESLINTALHEIRLRGESKAACAAFATLATDEGATTALRLLQEK